MDATIAYQSKEHCQAMQSPKHSQPAPVQGAQQLTSLCFGAHIGCSV
jgi:hypothetical protein